MRHSASTSYSCHAKLLHVKSFLELNPHLRVLFKCMIIPIICIHKQLYRISNINEICHMHGSVGCWIVLTTQGGIYLIKIIYLYWFITVWTIKATIHNFLWNYVVLHKQGTDVQRVFSYSTYPQKCYKNVIPGAGIVETHRRYSSRVCHEAHVSLLT